MTCVLAAEKGAGIIAKIVHSQVILPLEQSCAKYIFKFFHFFTDWQLGGN